MSFEVELKAHVPDPERLRALLPSPLLEEDKDDVYYSLPGGPALFRIRREVVDGKGETLFTYKEKKKEGGIETNGEWEFTAPADQFGPALLFARKLGYEVFVEKHKKGWSCSLPSGDLTLGDAHAELVEVPPLGWFFEVEFVLEDMRFIIPAENALKAILARFGIEESAIEPAYYMDMLRSAAKREEDAVKKKAGEGAVLPPSGAVQLWTDGGCSGNPGPGGWAYVIADGDRILAEANGGEKDTTNNKMELSAVIGGLKECERLRAKKIEVVTDSQYVKNGITSWIGAWKAKGWKTADKKPVKNQDLWEDLDALVSRLPVSFRWVKGHAGVALNERCDALVQKAIGSLRS